MSQCELRITKGPDESYDCTLTIDGQARTIKTTDLEKLSTAWAESTESGPKELTVDTAYT